MSLVGRAINASPVPFVGRRWQAPVAPTVDRSQLLGKMTAAGVLFAIVDRCASATAQVEWKLYRKNAKGERTEILDHPALRLVNTPSPFTTRQSVFEAGQQHYELVGETYLVVSYSDSVRIPRELWVVRPDRISPNPDSENFVDGYTYRGPDGEKIRLENDEVLSFKRPNPLDPYSGIGAVQSVLAQIDSDRWSAEWNKNFFLNGAQPGGIIEVDKRLSDPEFDEMRDRWKSQHQGVANAHRVAILERAKYLPLSHSQKDMQFTELATLSGEKVREAFGFPKPLLGTVEDVNRANAEAAEYVFAKWLVVHRLERWKQMLNQQLLPLFKSLGAGLEFDYESPVPENEEAEQAERAAKIEAARTLILDMGAEPAEVFAWLELPAFKIATPSRASVPPANLDGVATNLLTDAILYRLSGRASADDSESSLPDLPVPPKGVPDTNPNPPTADDLAPVQESWEEKLALLLSDYEDESVVIKAAIVAAILYWLRKNDISGLKEISVSSDDLAAAIAQRMAELYEVSAGHAVDEGAAQGVTLEPGTPDTEHRASVAQVAATTLTAVLIGAAVAETLRRWTPAAVAATVAQWVAEHLDALSLATPTTVLGGVLTGAQRDARIDTFSTGPPVQLYASEVLDAATCEPCELIHDHWIGELPGKPPLDTYPAGIYVFCEGGWRCRGQVVAQWP